MGVEQACCIRTVLEGKVMMHRARLDLKVEDKEIDDLLAIRDVEA